MERSERRISSLRAKVRFDFHLPVAECPLRDRCRSFTKPSLDVRFPQSRPIPLPIAPASSLPPCMSDVIAYGRDRVDFIREDFWFIVVTEGNEDETEINEPERPCGENGTGYSPQDTFAKFEVLWVDVDRGESHKGVIKARYGDQIPPNVEPVTVSWMPQPVVGFGIKEA